MDKKPDVYNPTFWHYLLIVPIFLVLRLLMATIRFKWIGQSAHLCSNPERMLGIAWHSNIFFLAAAKIRLRPKLNMSGLVSASKDAAYLVAFFNLMGIRSVRGSHKRRGREAILDLVDELKTDSDAFITPDGPRGPAGKAKKGFYVVAEAADVRILLVRFKPHCSIKIPSWDKFVVPLPFSLVEFEAKEFKSAKALADMAESENKTVEQFASDYMNFV